MTAEGRKPVTMTTSSAAFTRLLVFAACGLIVACGPPAPQKRQPMGRLPNATTTAEPEWLPFGIRVGEVRAVDPRETRLRDLRRIPSEGDATFVGWSPGGRKLVFEETLGRASRAVVVDLETRKSRPLAVGARDARRPRFVRKASDSLTVLLRGEESTSGFSLTTSTLDGSGLSILAGPELDPTDAIAVGSTVLFVGGEGGERAIYTREGSAQPVLAVNAPGDESDLALSPDETTVLFTTRRGPKTAVMAASYPDMTRHQRPVTADDVLAGQASFAADARHVVFSSAQDSAARDIYMTSLDGPRDQAPVRITFAPRGSEAPAVSPDGAFIAFVSAREGGGKKDVYVARWSMPE